MCVDVSDLTAVESALKTEGPIHLLVNNAGVSQLQSVLDTTSDVYDKYILQLFCKCSNLSVCIYILVIIV